MVYVCVLFLSEVKFPDTSKCNAKVSDENSELDMDWIGCKL